MQFFSNLSISLQSLRAARWRSFLTIVGIVIGIVSVLTIVGLGEGVKRQVAYQVQGLGSNLITIRSGAPTASGSNTVAGININVHAVLGASTLTDADIDTVVAVDNVQAAVPISYITSNVTHKDKTLSQFLIVGTNEELPDLINQKVEYGTFFNSTERTRHVAVIGRTVAEQLFEENVPVGKLFTMKGQEFVVRGIMEHVASGPLSAEPDYNSMIFIPYNIGKSITGGTAQINHMLATPKPEFSVDDTVAALKDTLLAAHQGQEDFSVLRQEDTLTVTNTVLDLLTAMTGSIAAISLFVGGIGIMNIMLVSVTERTYEVGIRKAIGATNRQILNQFMTEAVVLSLLGGLLGIAVSFGVNGALRAATSLQPVLTWQVVACAMGVSLAVGTIFGVAPAIKAARKDPIAALRHE